MPIPGVPVAPAPVEAVVQSRHIQRDEAIERIKAALKRRSGRSWSVTGGRGTARGWLNVTVPPKQRIDGGMNADDCKALADLFGLPSPVHFQGLSIGPDERTWYVRRAEGTPTE